MTDVACPHCTTQIPAQATRCPHCTGEVRFCPSCNRAVAVRVREQWKGFLRGGHQQVVTCIPCGKVLEGSRF